MDARGRHPRGAGRHAGEVAGGPPRLRRGLGALPIPRRRGGGHPPPRGRGGAARRAGGGRHRAAGARDGGAGGGDDGELRDLARLAIAALGRAGEPGGAAAVDMQRIRRALDLPRRRPGDPPTCPHGRPPRADRALRAPPPARLERAQVARTGVLPPARPLRELDRAPPPARRPTSPRCTGWWPSSSAASRPRAGAATGARAPWTCAARSAPRSRRAGCRCAYATARAGPGGRSSTCCAMSPRA